MKNLLAMAMMLAILLPMVLATHTKSINLPIPEYSISGDRYTGTRNNDVKLYYNETGGSSVYNETVSVTFLIGVGNIELSDITGVDWSQSIYAPR